MAGLMGFLSSIDPTRVGKASTAGVDESKKRMDEALAQGQGMLEKRMAESKAPTIEKVAGPQAGRIDTQFLEALRGQMPSGAQALKGAGGAQALAQSQAQEATGLLREAAMGGQPSAAQLQQKQAFEQAIAAQMAAQAGQGYNPAAVRQAQIQGAQLQAQQAQQAGILAAQEQAAAREQFATAATQGTELGLRQQELALKASQGDVQAQLDLAKIASGTYGQQAELETRAGIAGAQIGAEQAISQAQLEAGAQQQINALAIQYQQAGMSAAEAQQRAAMTMFENEQARLGQISQGRSALIGGLLGAGGPALGGQHDHRRDVAQAGDDDRRPERAVERSGGSVGHLDRGDRDSRRLYLFRDAL